VPDCLGALPKGIRAPDGHRPGHAGSMGAWGAAANGNVRGTGATSPGRCGIDVVTGYRANSISLVTAVNRSASCSTVSDSSCDGLFSPEIEVGQLLCLTRVPSASGLHRLRC